MQASLRVVSTPTADTPSTVVVINTDNKQYMIGNMGEATQRTMTELGVRLVKMNDFFLTGRSEWRNLGGLLGMVLTKADQTILSSQDPKRNSKSKEEPISLRITGPPNLNYTIATSRRVIFKRGLPLRTSEVRGDSPRGENQEVLPSFVDENVRSYAMSISPLCEHPSPVSSTSSGKKRGYDEMNDVISTSEPNEKDQSPTVSQTPDDFAEQVVSRMFNSDWLRDALFEKRLSAVALPATVFWRAPGSNKIEPFDWSAADQDPIVLVREPWPATKIATLPPAEPAMEAISYIIKTADIRGKFDAARADALNVPRGAERGRLSKGSTVQLNNGDTITPDMVVGPTRLGMALAVVDLPSVDYVKPLISRSEWELQEIKDSLQLIVWILGPGVASDPVLKSFMESLPQVKHLVSSLDLGSNQIMFKKSAGSILRLSRTDKKRFEQVYSGNQILSPTSYERYQPAASNCLAENAEPLELCSALPSLYRNVSANLVRVPGYGSYLLDCGEGTFGQLQRAFRPAELVKIFKDLRMIYLSHPHADHILGIVSVIKAWYHIVHKGRPSSQSAFEALDSISANPESAGATKRLAVVASAGLLRWLKEYSSVEDFGYSQTWPIWCQYDNVKLIEGEEEKEVPRSLFEPLFGLQNLQTCKVHHCQNAQGVSLTWPEATRADHSDEDSKPFKVSYSGDCRPSYAKFAQMGRHSTLLIHEATFEDGLLGDAQAKKHSTTSEALAVGARMRAKCVLLTHFSQRYQKLPVLEREPEGKDDDKAIGENESAPTAVAQEEGQEDDNAMDVDGLPAEADAFSEMSSKAPPKVVVNNDMRIGFASDLMKIKIGEFAELEYFVPAMEKLFAEEVKEEGEAEEGLGRKEEAKPRGQPNGKGKGNGKNANWGNKQQMQKGNAKWNGGKAKQGAEKN
ncbi:ribonuclease Z mitochondrial precursor [Phyllosticta citricarpa]|uniref:ribonuclease Z n=1 Tax=Phyllosticta citricarpa TaxID=55181 RepID=A0ABR1M943_9PEZI